jgi:transmembrane sensor
MTLDVRNARKRPDDHLLDEAAEWIGRLRAPDLCNADREAFAHWLDRSPAHRGAFDTMADLHDGLGVLAETGTTAVVSTPHRAAALPRPVLAAAAGFLVAVAVLFGTLQWFDADRLELQTARGETRELLLPDGTRLQLNTATSVEFEAGDDYRNLHLALGGEIYVDVAHDPSRPFVVRTDHGDARAVGTAFGVRAEAARTTVNVVEGEVAVRSTARTGAVQPEYRVSAGRRLAVTAGAAPNAPGEVDTSALGWRDGHLIYDDVSLSVLVEDLNRYLPRRMTISDAALANTRVSAILTLSDQDTMLEALAEVLPLGWVRISDQLVVIHPA